MSDAAARTAERARSFAVAASPDALWRLGVAGLTAVVAGFLFARLTVWPPHEDETLALFTGRAPVGELWRTVLGERGGAPLHFLFAWAIAHTGGGLVELRLVSAFFAIASVPLIAVLVARLTDRVVALVATAIVVPSWMLLFHGIYGRMYSLFLFTSALSYLALLVAVERRDRRGWTLWALAVLACIATHPYGALVVASQGLYVLYARRLREALPAFVVVGAARRFRSGAATPCWRAGSTSASAAAGRSSAARSRSSSTSSAWRATSPSAGSARGRSWSSSRSPGSSCSCAATARAASSPAACS